ncbi:MAG: ComF family protein [Gemmatimonadaceae bacterium]
MSIRDGVRAIAEVLLPPVCAVCDREVSTPDEALVCAVCWARLQQLPYPQCDRCGHPGTDAACQWCALLPPYVRSARSVCWMPDATAGPIVHAFKYSGWYRLAGELAQRMARLSWPADVLSERCGIVPVPLSETRARERGYNQCRLLADALAPRWKLPVYDGILCRTAQTRAQARLTPEERLHNVAHAFRVTDLPRQLHGSHLVLVDDVITTSATLNACATALFDSGVRVVSYVTFGRARSLGDVPT